MRHDNTRESRSGIALATFFVGAAALAACGDAATPSACTTGDPADQRHGATCLCCHAEFGVAGSIDPNGAPVATVVVTDARGEVAVMSPNAFGNFFRHFEMTPPFEARVVSASGEEQSMQALAPSADCNACHASGGVTAPIHGP